MKKIKVFASACVLLSFMMLMTLTVSGGAIELEADKKLTMEQLADKYLTVTETTSENGGETIKYANVAALRQKIKAVNPNITDVELGREIYLALGEDEDVVNDFPEYKLLEALDFQTCVQNVNYLKSTEEGSEIITKSEAVNALTQTDSLTDDGKELVLNNADLIYNDGISTCEDVVTTSNDGYMKLTATAYSTSTSSEGRTTYSISGTAKWLKIPLVMMRDTFVIATDGKHINGNKDYGCYSQDATVYFLQFDEECKYYENRYVEMRQYGDYYDDYSETPNEIEMSIDNSCSVIMEFDVNLTDITPTDSIIVNYSNMYAYISSKCTLKEVDGTFQIAYGHKTFGFNGLSVSIGYPFSVSITPEFATTCTEYKSNSYTIYYEIV